MALISLTLHRSSLLLPSSPYFINVSSLIVLVRFIAAAAAAATAVAPVADNSASSLD